MPSIPAQQEINEDMSYKRGSFSWGILVDYTQGDSRSPERFLTQARPTKDEDTLRSDGVFDDKCSGIERICTEFAWADAF